MEEVEEGGGGEIGGRGIGGGIEGRIQREIGRIGGGGIGGGIRARGWGVGGEIRREIEEGIAGIRGGKGN
ncbi:hypothetical protein HPP92_002629 [Vanilla planifolia]|uniref:Uncharacterized protein n=1 Tax=Vanilla planifolia TaxID=51239 RepID=A0A835RW83_VANPL|nr:hypothetical protein HPP92_002629 [Vanilla planifolia]